MSDSRSPKLLKGALVQFSAPMLIPIPNIIVFQYNPESLTRTMSPYDPPLVPPPSETGAGKANGPPLVDATSQPFDPTETFSLNLLLDATDALERPEAHPVAVLSGVADRVSALEMLLYPVPKASGALGLSAAASVSVGTGGIGISGAAGAAAAAPEPPRKVPLVLFVWGPGRIVPVRLTAFSVEELQYNHLLYPHRARVTVGLRVIPSESLTDKAPEYELARFAYDFTRRQKQVLALANVANTVDSILGMLPF